MANLNLVLGCGYTNQRMHQVMSLGAGTESLNSVNPRVVLTGLLHCIQFASIYRSMMITLVLFLS